MENRQWGIFMVEACEFMYCVVLVFLRFIWN
jgi:hypothetical protein